MDRCGDGDIEMQAMRQEKHSGGVSESTFSGGVRQRREQLGSSQARDLDLERGTVGSGGPDRVCGGDLVLEVCN